MHELKMLVNSGLLLRIEYNTAIVHPCDGLIPCNRPKTIIPDKTAKISCNYSAKCTMYMNHYKYHFYFYPGEFYLLFRNLWALILYVLLYEIYKLNILLLYPDFF
jgi:hypothetical protein